jgi:biopolymer transport protein ExbD
MRRFALAVCVIGVTLGACDGSFKRADPPIKPSNTITVEADSTVLWNGTKVDFSTLDRLFVETAKRTPQPEMHLELDKLAKYDAVAKIVDHAQKAGAAHIYFSGVDNPN